MIEDDEDDDGIVIENGFFLFWDGFPSNWTLSPFKIHNQEFESVEQYMMAEKAAFFGDTETYNKILQAKTPREQKKLGREVKNYIESAWAEVRYSLVLRGTLEKYRQNLNLKAKLLDTKDLIFVEASPKDVVWGIGLDAQDPRAYNEKTWLGLNLLGKAVTAAREIIKGE